VCCLLANRFDWFFFLFFQEKKRKKDERSLRMLTTKNRKKKKKKKDASKNTETMVEEGIPSATEEIDVASTSEDEQEDASSGVSSQRSGSSSSSSASSSLSLMLEQKKRKLAQLRVKRNNGVASLKARVKRIESKRAKPADSSITATKGTNGEGVTAASELESFLSEDNRFEEVNHGAHLARFGPLTPLERQIEEVSISASIR